MLSSIYPIRHCPCSVFLLAIFRDRLLVFPVYPYIEPYNLIKKCQLPDTFLK